MDEIVALYDEDGNPSGTAPRSVVRRDNLRHGATAVIVRNSYGQVYVHRRTDDKDVFPGLHDCCAGGVLLAGEEPADGARREAAEELGVTGAELRPVLTEPYADEHTRYWAFGYEVTYDGPVTWQPEEVAWGRWMSLEELDRRLADASWPFVPDSRALVARWLADRLADREPPAGGRDGRVTIVEGRWVDREPRRPEVADRLLVEAELMPWLARALPLAVPRPRIVQRGPLRVRHPIVPGTPLEAATTTPAHASALAAFLRALGAVPVPAAQQHGLGTARAARERHEHFLDEARARVLPRLDGPHRQSAERLLDRARRMPYDSVVHAELGPEQVLADGDRVCGVIGWGDVQVGDRARDLAWALYGTPQAFADAFARAYGVTDALTGRALVWHRLGPWREVLHGLDHDRPDLVESGLARL
ncbi:MAG: phosphotransferase [Nocardioidaceae bacterium]